MYLQQYSRYTDDINHNNGSCSKQSPTLVPATTLVYMKNIKTVGTTQQHEYTEAPAAVAVGAFLLPAYEEDYSSNIYLLTVCQVSSAYLLSIDHGALFMEHQVPGNNLSSSMRAGLIECIYQMYIYL